MKNVIKSRYFWLGVAALWVTLVALTSPLWLTVLLAGMASLAIAVVLTLRRSSAKVARFVPVCAVTAAALFAGSWWLGADHGEPVIAVPPTSAAPSTTSASPSTTTSTSARPTPTPTANPSASASTKKPSPKPSATSWTPTPTTQTPTWSNPSPTPYEPEPSPTVVWTKDVCPNGDWSGNRYDRRCGTPPQPAEEPTRQATDTAPTTRAAPTSKPTTAAPTTQTQTSAAQPTTQPTQEPTRGIPRPMPSTSTS